MTQPSKKSSAQPRFRRRRADGDNLQTEDKQPSTKPPLSASERLKKGRSSRSATAISSERTNLRRRSPQANERTDTQPVPAPPPANEPAPAEPPSNQSSRRVSVRSTSEQGTSKAHHAQGQAEDRLQASRKAKRDAKSGAKSSSNRPQKQAPPSGNTRFDLSGLLGTSEESSQGSLLEMNLDDSFAAPKNIHSGDQVTGTIRSITPEGYTIDIGAKQEAFLPSAGLDGLELGATVTATVLRADLRERGSGIVLMIEQSSHFEELDWELFEELQAQGQSITGIVHSKVNGGFRIRIGEQMGFCPVSHLSAQRITEENEQMFIGQSFDFNILELREDDRGGSIILSRKQLLETERAELRRSRLIELSTGMTISGTVARVLDFGVFVDLGGVDGLLSTREITRAKINPEELNVGLSINVEILQLDAENERISLAIPNSDPWRLIEQGRGHLQTGSIVEGSIVKVVDFGCFVELQSGLQGLLHISTIEEHNRRNAEPLNAAIGERLSVQVRSIDARRRRLDLGLADSSAQAAVTEEPEVVTTMGSAFASIFDSLGNNN